MKLAKYVVNFFARPESLFVIPTVQQAKSSFKGGKRPPHGNPASHPLFSRVSPCARLLHEKIRMRLTYAIAAALLAVVFAAGASTSKKSAPYAAGATDLWEEMWAENGPGGPATVRVTSPDGKKSVATSFDSKTGDVLLRVRSDSVDSTINIGPGVQSAVEWSPDSKAFFLTTSDQGANGWYHTLVYLVGANEIKKIDPTPLVLKTFGHPVKCTWLEDPNVAAITWLHDSKRILVAAEILHHSVCDSFGTFKAYEVALPALRIVRTYGQLETKKLFRDSLGWEIKDAPDNCIRDPKSCWVSANHEPHQ
ncbi:MAG: hypothetical protein ACYDCD_03675 [Candidatus Acidiferrales bacterium]